MWIFLLFSFEYVLQFLFGEGKLIDNLYQWMDEIQCCFDYDKFVFVCYNLKDCEFVMCIFDKVDLLFFVFECVSVMGFVVDCIGGLVVVFMYLYLLCMYWFGYVVLNFGDVMGQNSFGGFVMDLCFGLYDLVFVFDYKSFYLLIICMFLIDLVGLIEGFVYFVDEILVFGFFGVCFLCIVYCLFDIVWCVWEGCDDVKWQCNVLLLQVLKIIMNLFYGVFGLIGCCFFDLCFVLLIMMCGYEIMYCMCKLIEVQGYEVIYGDIDLMFVWFGCVYDDDEVGVKGCVFVEYVNCWW